MGDWQQMWKGLQIEIHAHQELLDSLGPVYQQLFIDRPNRPRSMGYFDAVVGDIHGGRVAELLDARSEGRPVVGIFCIFVPEEIIIAAGGICVGVCGGAQMPIPWAEEVLPRTLCPLVKSAVGFKLSRTCPYFQVLTEGWGETTCDGKKKAWETLSEFMPFNVLEVPQTKTGTAFGLWFSEVKRFSGHMQVAGRPFSAPELKDAIALVNEKRRAMQRLARLRWSNPPVLSGLDGLLIEQLSFFDDPERFTAQVNALADELEKRVEKGPFLPKDAPRIMVAGSPMPIPHWKVHAIVEGAGALVVHEESCIGSRYYRDLVEPSGDDAGHLLEAIARRYFKITCACFTPNTERVERVVEEAVESGAQGVIYHSLSFCQIYEGEALKVKRALEDKGIPTLVVSTDYSTEDVEQLRTRVEAFLEEIA